MTTPTVSASTRTNECKKRRQIPNVTLKKQNKLNVPEMSSCDGIWSMTIIKRQTYTFVNAEHVACVNYKICQLCHAEEELETTFTAVSNTLCRHCGAKVGLKLWVLETQSFFLYYYFYNLKPFIEWEKWEELEYLLFINYCIFQMNNCKPTFAPPCFLSYEKSHMEGNNKALFPEQA